jgi:MFS transporter, DHA1 family, tetracycline resistance protein
VNDIRARSRHGALFVLATIFIDAIGFGLVMPVLPQLLIEVGGGTLSDAIAIGGWMSVAMAVAAFVAAPVLGNLSDRFGRRPVLLVALGFLALDYLLLAWAQSIVLIFVARTLSGAFGGSYAPAMAAIADISTPQDRARNFGYVSAAFGVGFVLGPALGGLLGEFGTRAPFYAAAALAGLNVLYGLLVFPETLASANRRPFRWRRANPLGALKTLRALPGMTAVALVLVLWQVASLVYPLTWSFFAIARFGWSPGMIGASLAAVGLIIALAQVFVTGPAVKRFGERDAATIGLAFAILGFVGYALVKETWQAYVVMVCIALQSFVQPSLMAMLSRRATPDTQGEVQGIASMALGIGSIVAPMLLTAPLSYFTSPAAPFRFDGAAFVIAALVGLAAIALLRRIPSSRPD